MDLCVLIICAFLQEVEVRMDGINPSDLPGPDVGNEESQDPQGKAPVRFGWIVGVMVSKSSLCETILQIQAVK